MIKQATRDESSEVKIIAASTLKKIEQPLLDDIQKWYKKTELNKSDINAYINLGNTCLKYCQLGISDELNRANFLKRSEEAFQNVLLLNPERTDLFIKISKIFLERFEYDSALEYVNKYLFLYPDDYKGYIYKCEALFQQRKFKQLKEFINQIDFNKNKNWKELQSLKAVWV